MDKDYLRKDTLLDGLTNEEIEKMRLEEYKKLSLKLLARLTGDQINHILDINIKKTLENKSDKLLVKEASEAIRKDRLNKINNAKALKSLNQLGIGFLHDKIFYKNEKVNYYSAFFTKNEKEFNNRKELIRAYNKKEKEIKNHKKTYIKNVKSFSNSFPPTKERKVA